MKLVFAVVSAFVIFPADARDLPDKPGKADFAVEQVQVFSSDSENINNEPGDRRVDHNTKNFPDVSGTNCTFTDDDLESYTACLLFPNYTEVIQQSRKERKGGYETPLRASCSDYSGNCPRYAREGYCKDNPYMYDYCPKSCCGGCCGVLIGDFWGGKGVQYLTFETEKINWLWALSHCLNNRARLAALKDPAAFHSYVGRHYPGERFWLAGSDQHKEGDWIWGNGQSLGKFPWPPGQPDNAGGAEDCLEWGYGNNFNDEPCEKHQRYVCDYASYGTGYN